MSDTVPSPHEIIQQRINTHKTQQEKFLRLAAEHKADFSEFIKSPTQYTHSVKKQSKGRHHHRSSHKQGTFSTIMPLRDSTAMVVKFNSFSGQVTSYLLSSNNTHGQNSTEVYLLDPTMMRLDHTTLTKLDYFENLKSEENFLGLLVNSGEYCFHTPIPGSATSISSPVKTLQASLSKNNLDSHITGFKIHRLVMHIDTLDEADKQTIGDMQDGKFSIPEVIEKIDSIYLKWICRSTSHGQYYNKQISAFILNSFGFISTLNCSDIESILHTDPTTPFPNADKIEALRDFLLHDLDKVKEEYQEYKLWQRIQEAHDKDNFKESLHLIIERMELLRRHLHLKINELSKENKLAKGEGLSQSRYDDTIIQLKNSVATLKSLKKFLCGSYLPANLEPIENLAIIIQNADTSIKEIGQSLSIKYLDSALALANLFYDTQLDKSLLSQEEETLYASFITELKSVTTTLVTSDDNNPSINDNNITNPLLKMVKRFESLKSKPASATSPTRSVLPTNRASTSSPSSLASSASSSSSSSSSPPPEKVPNTRSQGSPLEQDELPPIFLADIPIDEKHKEFWMTMLCHHAILPTLEAELSRELEKFNALTAPVKQKVVADIRKESQRLLDTKSGRSIFGLFTVSPSAKALSDLIGEYRKLITFTCDSYTMLNALDSYKQQNPTTSSDPDLVEVVPPSTLPLITRETLETKKKDYVDKYYDYPLKAAVKAVLYYAVFVLGFAVAGAAAALFLSSGLGAPIGAAIGCGIAGAIAAKVTFPFGGHKAAAHVVKHVDNELLNPITPLRGV